MHFLNMMTKDKFQEPMTDIINDDPHGPIEAVDEKRWIFRGRTIEGRPTSVELHHSVGDAAHYETLDKLLVKGKFTVAIIVPPLVDPRMAEYQPVRGLSRRP